MPSVDATYDYGQIAPSDVEALLEKVRKQNYSKYLSKVILTKVRGFETQTVRFEFPVTALVGPNGGGKTTILGAAAIAYSGVKPRTFFAKSGRFDDSMQDWSIEYELIDKTREKNDTVRRTASYRQAKWNRDALDRQTLVFGVSRTVPAGERKELQQCISNSYSVADDQIAPLSPPAAAAVGRILGKDVSAFSVAQVDERRDIDLLAGQTADADAYSEFHFGAGESSIIRMVSEIETSEDGALILIEEIENGLHPIATAQMVAYLIDVALRKKCQILFTTHSDDALRHLPPQAIWAAVENQVYQGKLSIKSLRAIAGQVDAKLVIFAEDEFATEWVRTMLRKEMNRYALDAIQIHPMSGDSIAVEATRHHNRNPTATQLPALCIIDGDSEQEDDGVTIFRLPGALPEAVVFDGVVSRLSTCLGKLSEALLVGYNQQAAVEDAVREAAVRNKDRHTIFLEVGAGLGLLPERTVRDAFLSIWTDEFTAEAEEFREILRPYLPLVTPEEESSTPEAEALRAEEERDDALAQSRAEDAQTAQHTDDDGNREPALSTEPLAPPHAAPSAGTSGEPLRLPLDG